MFEKTEARELGAQNELIEPKVKAEPVGPSELSGLQNLTTKLPEVLLAQRAQIRNQAVETKELSSKERAQLARELSNIFKNKQTQVANWNNLGKVSDGAVADIIRPIKKVFGLKEYFDLSSSVSPVPKGQTPTMILEDRANEEPVLSIEVGRRGKVTIKEISPILVDSYRKRELSISPKEEKANSYEYVDKNCRSKTGKSFFEFCKESGGLDGIVATESEFRAIYDKSVSRLIVGGFKRELALFAAYSEEDSFRKNADGSLSIDVGFVGFNVPHQMVMGMLDRLHRGVKFNSRGKPTGSGYLYIDEGSFNNVLRVEVNFSKNTISPKLWVTSSTGAKDEVQFKHIERFIETYTKAEENRFPQFNRKGNRFVIGDKQINPSAMNIFVPKIDHEVMAHETWHALYDSHPPFKEKILSEVRESTEEQRECAVMYLASYNSYDVFDPNTPDFSQDLVVDEVFNAYAFAGRYNPKTMQSTDISIGDFLRDNELDVSLDKYKEVEKLPVSEETVSFLTERYEKLKAETPELSEEEYIEKYKSYILSNTKDFSVLRDLLKEQHPVFYARKVQEARTDLVDWVDG